MIKDDKNKFIILINKLVYVWGYCIKFIINHNKNEKNSLLKNNSLFIINQYIYIYVYGYNPIFIQQKWHTRINQKF